MSLSLAAMNCTRHIIFSKHVQTTKSANHVVSRVLVAYAEEEVDKKVHVEGKVHRLSRGCVVPSLTIFHKGGSCHRVTVSHVTHSMTSYGSSASKPQCHITHHLNLQQKPRCKTLSLQLLKYSPILCQITCIDETD